MDPSPCFEIRAHRTRRALLQGLAAAGLGLVAPRGQAQTTTRPQARAAPPLAVIHDDGRSVSLLDPDSLRPQARHRCDAPARRLLPLRDALVVPTADGRLLRLALADGRWRSLALGQGLPRVAASRDGRWLLAVPEPATELWLLDAALQPLRRWPLPGPVAWLADAPGRQSFLLALARQPALWELSYDERAPDFYDGLVHDYRMGEGVPQRGFHNVRRMSTPVPLRHGNLDHEHTELLAEGLVFNLDARRPLRHDAGWRPAAAGAAALVLHQDRPAMVVPVAGEPRLELLRTGDWSRMATVPLAAPARAVRRVGPLEAPTLLLALGEGAAADRLMPVAWPSLQALPPWTLPGPCVGEPPADIEGRSLWVLHAGPDPALRRLDARDGLVQAQQPLPGPQDLAWSPG